MSDNPKIHISTGFNGGVSVNLRADSVAELAGLVDQLTQTAAVHPGVAALAQQLLGPMNASPAAAQVAVQNVQAAVPGSTVGQAPPWQQPVAAPPVQAPAYQAPAGPPPGAAYPGNCVHGVRVYNDKPGRGGKPWQRWECAIPWSRDAVGRCESINV